MGLIEFRRGGNDRITVKKKTGSPFRNPVFNHCRPAGGVPDVCVCVLSYGEGFRLCRPVGELAQGLGAYGHGFAGQAVVVCEDADFVPVLRH